ncbi:hypothetical protein Q3G72_013284 [Acer saccharum]|nr:hypothetical protein Q3G72_013284 [Acer saccharum]
MTIRFILYILTCLFVKSESITPLVELIFPDGFVFGTASSAYQVPMKGFMDSNPIWPYPMGANHRQDHYANPSWGLD